MHFQHHAKPNCFGKDPDIKMHPLFFALGKVLSVEVSWVSVQRGTESGLLCGSRESACSVLSAKVGPGAGL